MRIEKITKRKRKNDNTFLMIILAIGFLLWAFIGNMFSSNIGFTIFMLIAGYAFVFQQKNELGENRKQAKLKKTKYYKEVQTFVFSRNYK